MSEQTRTRRNWQWQLLRASRFVVATTVVSCATTADDQSNPRSTERRWDTAALSRWYPHEATGLTRLGLAIALTRALVDDAAKQGAVTPEELASWTAYHWAQVDRPQVFRTTHAVVRLAAGASPVDIAKGERVATAISGAAAGSPDADAFQQRANSVSTDGLEVKVEALDFVAEDGRVMRLGAKPPAQAGSYDPAFARAAHLCRRSARSAPTRPNFGFHIIRLEETLPAVRLDEAVRIDMARTDALDRRARLLTQALLTAERKRTNPVTERSAEEATAKVSVE